MVIFKITSKSKPEIIFETNYFKKNCTVGDLQFACEKDYMCFLYSYDTRRSGVLAIEVNKLLTYMLQCNNFFSWSA